FTIGRAAATNPVVDVHKPRFDLHLPSLFVQDEVTVIPERLLVTAGVKLEHNDFTRTQVQPNLLPRLPVSQRHMLLRAQSRAVRTPDAVESDNIFAIGVGAPLTGPDGQPYVPTLVGDARPNAEVLRAHEAGYRVKFSARASLDIAAFYNEYHNLITYGPVTGL